MYGVTESDGETCEGCGASVIEPYIKCAECTEKFVLCLHCFARGLEIGSHQNNHSYEVVKDDFTVLDTGWTAAEEKRLLEAVSECGIGNWHDICNQVKTKNSQQCEHHYNKCYINNPVAGLPALEERSITVHPAPVIFRPCEDPPRPADGSTLQLDMSGYMAARGDFTVEHNNFAELDIKDLEWNREDWDIEKELKLTVLDVYRNVLLERKRRKDIVRNYGLINFRRQHAKDRKYFTTIGFQKMERLRCFMKVLPPIEWDMYLESSHFECELRSHIKDLQEYAENGIHKLASARVYDMLKIKRIDDKMRRHLLEDVYQAIQDDQMCRHDSAVKSILKAGNESLKGLTNAILPNAVRRAPPPLEIMGLPSYEKLTADEKELCTSARIVPEAYLQYKRILTNEQNRSGYVRLAAARTLIKIDVNKTRKVYDFLCKEGYICKDYSRKETDTLWKLH